MKLLWGKRLDLLSVTSHFPCLYLESPVLSRQVTFLLLAASLGQKRKGERGISGGMVIADGSSNKHHLSDPSLYINLFFLKWAGVSKHLGMQL